MNTPLTTRKPGKRRIMVQLWGTLDKAIRRDFAALNIKRDRYLNDLLRTEIEELAREVTFRNSDAVRARMQEKKLPDRVKLTIELDVEVVDRIDAVLTEKNIPRDAFINRILFFLVAKDSMLDALGIERDERAEATAKPLAEVKERLYDPFAHIRDANDQRFYTLACFNDGPLGGTGPNLFGMNTAISEADWTNLNMSTEDMLAELGLFPTAGSQQ